MAGDSKVDPHERIEAAKKISSIEADKFLSAFVQETWEPWDRFEAAEKIHDPKMRETACLDLALDTKLPDELRLQAALLIHDFYLDKKYSILLKIAQNPTSINHTR
ncbi:MAG: hypothetical protein EPN94_06755, partial [Nitrospirae bacterium]